MSYFRGTAQHEDYYKRNPDKLDKDEEFRCSPRILGPDSRNFDPLDSPVASSMFQFLTDIRPLSTGVISENKICADPEVITSRIKSITSYYGAQLVGVTRMQKEYYYSHHGSRELYGKPITDRHAFGIVFAVGMDITQISAAPGTPQTIESAHAYIRTATIGMMLSYYIRALGYNARNHMDGNYLVIASRVANAAGLGQFGRSGILITPGAGPRVKFEVVTTDMVLSPDDGPVDYGIPSFCKQCGLCAKYCPGRAITNDPTGAYHDADKCFSAWKKLGTDCGICLAVCPFSRGIDSTAVMDAADNPKKQRQLLESFLASHGEKPRI